MKHKIIESDFNRETGISKVTIQDKYGTFTGYSKLLPEDEDVVSIFSGCQFAHQKAIIKSLKARKRYVLTKKKALEDCLAGIQQSINDSNKELSFEQKFILKQIESFNREASAIQMQINFTCKRMRTNMANYADKARAIRKKIDKMSKNK